VGSQKTSPRLGINGFGVESTSRIVLPPAYAIRTMVAELSTTVQWARKMDEIEQVVQIIGDIYDASLDPALWPSVLETISSYVDSVAASIHSQDSISRAANVHFTWGSAESAPHYFKLYAEGYGKINPIFPEASHRDRNPATPPGQQPPPQPSPG